MQDQVEDRGRRSFLGYLSATAATVAVGVFAYVGGSFLYPIGRRKPPPLFVCLESQVPEDEPLQIRDPTGRKVLLLRKPGGEVMAISMFKSMTTPNQRTSMCRTFMMGRKMGIVIIMIGIASKKVPIANRTICMAPTSRSGDKGSPAINSTI